jgi:hypothetical protein
VAASNLAPLRGYARRIAAILIVATAAATLYLSDLPADTDLAESPYQFSFSRHPLPEVPGPEKRSFRRTHASLDHITAFMSTVGAAAALNDLDGDGLPNDVCYVDTRTDQVIVAPVPGTGDRYKPFALNANMREPLFDRETMAPLGCLPGDLDEDGHMDLIVYYAGRTPILFLSRSSAGGGALSASNFVPVDIIPGGQIWVTGSATLADLDGDGHLELVISNYFSDGSAIYDPQAKTPVYMPDSFSRAFNGGGLRIYRCVPEIANAERTVACTEVLDALPPSLPKGWGLAIAAYDIDGDLYPELYVANDFGPDRPGGPRVEGAWQRLIQGHGSRFRRPERRWDSRHFRE